MVIYYYFHEKNIFRLLERDYIVKICTNRRFKVLLVAQKRLQFYNETWVILFRE